MAIATNQGHVNRAIEFYNRVSKFFSIGRTTAWDDDSNPPAPTTGMYAIDELVGFKKVDNCYLVIQDPNGTIDYRTEKWRIVADKVETTTNANIASGATTVKLTSLAGITKGCKIRINNQYEGTVTALNTSQNQVTLDTAAPSTITSGAPVLGGALVENAKYVYLDCYLNYDDFPLVTYRQIGVNTGVEPTSGDILLSAQYSNSGTNEFTNVGTLEVVDNRKPTARQVDQKELIAILIEF